jgi:hypothetical protein
MSNKEKNGPKEAASIKEKKKSGFLNIAGDSSTSFQMNSYRENKKTNENEINKSSIQIMQQNLEKSELRRTIISESNDVFNGLDQEQTKEILNKEQIRIKSKLKTMLGSIIVHGSRISKPIENLLELNKSVSEEIKIKAVREKNSTKTVGILSSNPSRIQNKVIKSSTIKTSSTVAKEEPGFNIDILNNNFTDSSDSSYVLMFPTHNTNESQKNEESRKAIIKKKVIPMRNKKSLSHKIFAKKRLSPINKINSSDLTDRKLSFRLNRFNLESSSNYRKSYKLLNKEKSVINSSSLNYKRKKQQEKEPYLSIQSSGNPSINDISSRKIIRKKLVYDSYSDEEIEPLNQVLFIHPHSPLKYILDFFVCLGAITTIFFSPLCLAFFYEQTYSFRLIFVWSQIIVDLIFIFDCVSGFFLGFYDFEEELVRQKRRMFLNYFYTWFFFDLITAFPFNTILTGIEMKNELNSIAHVGFNLLKSESPLIKIITMIRNIKLIKVIRKNQFVDYIRLKYFEEIKISATLSRLLKFIFYFFIAAHMLACVYIYLAQVELPSWIINSKLQDQSSFDIYVASVYFIFSTIFTIGYGDILSANIYERFYNVLLLMVGILVYSYAVSSLSNVIQFQDEKTIKYNKSVEYFERLKLKYSVPYQLSEKIQRFLKYELKANKRDKKDFLEELPKSIKNEMILKMYRPMIDNFIFFKNFDDVDFIIKVIMALKPYSAIRNERLILEGDFLDEMIFVKKGTLVLEITLKVISDFNEDEKSYKRIINIKKRKSSLIFHKKKYNISALLYKHDFKGKLMTPIDNSFTKRNLRGNTRKQEEKVTYKKECRNSIKLSFLNKYGEIDSEGERQKNKVHLPDQQVKEKMKIIDTQYLKIIELKTNEHFGDVLMLLNRRCPLSIRVRSKFAELFLMKKTDVIEISSCFPQIIQKISKKSAYNQKQLDLLIKRTKMAYYINHKERFYKPPYYEKSEEIKVGKQQTESSHKQIFNDSKDPIGIKHSLFNLSENIQNNKYDIIDSRILQSKSDLLQNNTISSEDSDSNEFSQDTTGKNTNEVFEINNFPSMKSYITEKSNEHTSLVKITQPRISDCSNEKSKTLISFKTDQTEERQIDFSHVDRIKPYLEYNDIENAKRLPSKYTSSIQSTKEKNYPIMYNFNISNNYNFDNFSKPLLCSNCFFNNRMYNSNRWFSNIGIINAQIQWIKLQPEANINFTIHSQEENTKYLKTEDHCVASEFMKPYNTFNPARRKNSSKSLNTLTKKDVIESKNYKRTRFLRKASKSIPHYFKYIPITTPDKRKCSILSFQLQKENFFRSSSINKKLNNPIDVIQGSQEIKSTKTKNYKPIQKLKKEETFIHILNENIEKSSLNLHDPELFYSEFFKNVINKKHEERKKKIELIDTEKLNKRLDDLENYFFQISFV